MQKCKQKVAPSGYLLGATFCFAMKWKSEFERSEKLLVDKIGRNGVCLGLRQNDLARDADAELGIGVGAVEDDRDDRAVGVFEGNGLDRLGEAARADALGTLLDELAEMTDVVVGGVDSVEKPLKQAWQAVFLNCISWG